MTKKEREEIKKYCEVFKARYGVYPNLLTTNRITRGRFEDAFDDYYCKHDKEKSPHPVIDMKATGKLLEEVMKEEGVSPKIFARIMGWEKPQAVYRWYYGETLPSIDTLSILSKILNRPIESLLVTREIKN